MAIQVLLYLLIGLALLARLGGRTVAQGHRQMQHSRVRLVEIVLEKETRPIEAERAVEAFFLEVQLNLGERSITVGVRLGARDVRTRNLCSIRTEKVIIFRHKLLELYSENSLINFKHFNPVIELQGDVKV